MRVSCTDGYVADVCFGCGKNTAVEDKHRFVWSEGK